MLQLFRNSNPFSVLLLFLLALLVHMPVLLHPLPPDPHAAAPFGSIVLSGLDRFLLHKSRFGYVFAGIVSLWGGAVYANGIAGRNKLFGKSTALPGLTLILFSGLLPHTVPLGEHSLLMWALLLLLDCLLSTAQPKQPRKQVFNAGFTVGMLSLLSLPCAVFAFLLIGGMLLLRRPSPAEWVVALFGALTPFYFAAGCLFLADALPLFRSWAALSSFIPRHFTPKLLTVWVTIGAVVMYTAIGLLALQRSLGRTAISVRRGWAVCLIAAVLAAIACGLLWKVRGASLLLLIMLSFPAAVTFNRIKAPRFTNFMALLLLAAVIFCQYHFIS